MARFLRWSYFARHERFERCQTIADELFWPAGTRPPKLISVSHQWQTPVNPDPQGEQFRAFLVEAKRVLSNDVYYPSNAAAALKDEEPWGPDVVGVFFDYSCLPQKPRSAADQATFDAALPSINLCYLCTEKPTLVIPIGDPLALAQRAWCVMELTSALSSQCLWGYLDLGDKFANRLGGSFWRDATYQLQLGHDHLAATAFDYFMSLEVRPCAHDLLQADHLRVTNGSDRLIVARAYVKNIALLVERLQADRTAQGKDDVPSKWRDGLQELEREITASAAHGKPNKNACCVVQ